MSETERPDPLAPPAGYGERAPSALLAPSQRTDRPGPGDTHYLDTHGDAGRKPDTLCAVGREHPWSEAVCTAEHEFVWVFGDEAEHIMRVELCGAHGDQLAVQMAAGIRPRCTRCGHWCRLERVLSRATGEDTGYRQVIEAARSRQAQAALDRLGQSTYPHRFLFPEPS